MIQVKTSEELNINMARAFINYTKRNYHIKDRGEILWQLFSQYLKYQRK